MKLQLRLSESKFDAENNSLPKLEIYRSDVSNLLGTCFSVLDIEVVSYQESYDEAVLLNEEGRTISNSALAKRALEVHTVFYDAVCHNIQQFIPRTEVKEMS